MSSLAKLRLALPCVGEREDSYCSIRGDDLRALLAAAEALKKIVKIDDGDNPAFWPLKIANAFDAGRAALAQLEGE